MLKKGFNKGMFVFPLVGTNSEVSFVRNNNLLFFIEWPFEGPQMLKQTHTKTCNLTLRTAMKIKMTKLCALLNALDMNPQFKPEWESWQ